MELNFIEFTSGQIVENLRNGTLDVAVGAATGRHGDAPVQWKELFSLPTSLAELQQARHALYLAALFHSLAMQNDVVFFWSLFAIGMPMLRERFKALPLAPDPACLSMDLMVREAACSCARPPISRAVSARARARSGPRWIEAPRHLPAPHGQGPAPDPMACGHTSSTRTRRHEAVHHEYQHAPQGLLMRQALWL